MATDRRTKYTKTVIRDAFYELLLEKPIKKITVTDICKLADINRSTFYTYYEDVMALSESIQDELFENVLVSITTDHWYEDLLKLIDENKDVCSALIGPYGDASFLKHLIYLGYSNSMRVWDKLYPKADEKIKDYAYSFISGGIIAILENWVADGCQDNIEYVGRMMYGLSMKGISLMEEDALQTELPTGKLPVD
ncbi:MAG: TetR family transcriptional regulator C-terminal domain-containing protein [Eubacterium sp.]|nr:TetR family transcriptional regulator C-terminal domain-containing protein [Eubacterium sp.]